MKIDQQYIDAGFVLARGLLEQDDFLAVEQIVIKKIGKHFKPISSLNDPDWVTYSVNNPECVTKLYDEMRDHEVFMELGKSDKIVHIVRQLIREPELYRKVPFRIDVPFEIKELAFWHQDDFYVQGNDEELTAWIPLFDTRVQHGALTIMPRSQKLGRVPHTLSVGKKSLPVGVYHNEVRYVEMSRGDVLFFSPLLLHSSSLNISDQIRYSIQLRYTSSLKAPSTVMKGTVGV
jgi:ectoine hydroxylase-related dioxygenase (phytanoyl-CoA dioxygenase family)